MLLLLGFLLCSSVLYSNLVLIVRTSLRTGAARQFTSCCPSLILKPRLSCGGSQGSSFSAWSQRLCHLGSGSYSIIDTSALGSRGHSYTSERRCNWGCSSLLFWVAWVTAAGLACALLWDQGPHTLGLGDTPLGCQSLMLLSLCQLELSQHSDDAWHSILEADFETEQFFHISQQLVDSIWGKLGINTQK